MENNSPLQFAYDHSLGQKLRAVYFQFQVGCG